MTLTRNLRLANLERWYMYPGNVFEGTEYMNTFLEVFIFEENEIYILTITDIPKDSLFSNEELISDIEGLAHHLAVEKGSTQLFEFLDIDMSNFKFNPDSDGNIEYQTNEYKDKYIEKYYKEILYQKYPQINVIHENTTFSY
ncbi:hypothetical protein BHU61_05040 [Macrococcus epidermidis]|uniref:Uncharacterized protein n=1 Tax=Macrococcus epidermidis TaxID=1902580 RepID=A0A328A0B3_9STAP|nr:MULTISPECIES: hypothetical protein [Macrococcus]MCG7421183.1 hypothetical protein [Macrococcus epidermidis]MCH4986230.1 hypothetical protein [Macrococcus sp. PK]RAK46828.1 hypothetical protein BHU61_05040 [Macrococcus epidermidis]